MPAARTGKAVPVRRQVALLVERDGRYLVRPRPAEGFLGGLWEFPTAELRSGEDVLVAAGRLAGELGLRGEWLGLGRLKHAYSHFTLELELVRIETDSDLRAAEGGWLWQTPAQLEKAPLHGAHRKACVRFLLAGAQGGGDG